MGLFGKKKEKTETCCCGGNCSPEGKREGKQSESAEGAIKVLGSGCAKCNELERAAVQALEELGRDTAVEHVTDFTQIAAYGVMTTPALVVDGKVVSFGKVLKKDEVVSILEKCNPASPQ